MTNQQRPRIESATMVETELRQRLLAELPDLLRQDLEFRAWVEDQIRRVAVTPESFDARFDRMLREFAQDRAEQRRNQDEQNRKWEEHHRTWDAHREEQHRKWEEQSRKWEEQERRWQTQQREQNSKWEEQSRKWEEQERRWQTQQREQNSKWEEQERRWQDQNLKWDEQHRMNLRLLDEIAAGRKRQDQMFGAMGARWGLATEASFRAALKGILEQSFGVEVLNVNEFDDEGIVFGVPDQVEIDIIIKNGEVILCELKSSMSAADMYSFERKALYYANRHRHPITRKLAISPMVQAKAKAVAERYGIEIFSYAEDATGL